MIEKRGGGFVPSKKMCANEAEIGVFEALEGVWGWLRRFWWVRSARAAADGGDEADLGGSGARF